MSRILRPLILLTCLTALPVLAAQGLEAPTNCPGAVTEERAEPADSDTPPAPAPAAAVKASGGGSATDADSAPRSRPRWQSFLPGMVR